MALNIWEVFIALFRGGKETTEENDDTRFVPSPLDLSVRVGHGGQDGDAVRELSKISEQAREIEESHREN